VAQDTQYEVVEGLAYPVAHVTEAGTIVASLAAVTDASAVQLA